jgi:hypothetical protein
MPHAVAAEAPHAVAADGTHAVVGDGSHAVAGDGSHAVAADRRELACAACAPRLLPVKLGAEGQALRERLRAFRTQAVRKTTKFKVSTRPPATLPLSPRVLKRVFPFPALNAQLTLFHVLVAVFEVCGNGDDGIC